jgi:hypothetical protein
MDASRRLAGGNAVVAGAAGSITGVGVGGRDDATFVCDDLSDPFETFYSPGYELAGTSHIPQYTGLPIGPANVDPEVYFFQPVTIEQAKSVNAMLAQQGYRRIGVSMFTSKLADSAPAKLPPEWAESSGLIWLSTSWLLLAPYRKIKRSERRKAIWDQLPIC